MPKVTIGSNRGLVQTAGSGLSINSATGVYASGLEGVVSSAETTLAAATGNTDIEFAMPAGALVTDFGFAVTSAVGGAAAGGTMTVDLGTAAGGAQLVAAVAVANANAIMVAGSSMSVVNAVEAVASGAPFGDFKDASTLHATAARTLYARFTQGAGAAAAAGKVIAYVKYTILS